MPRKTTAKIMLQIGELVASLRNAERSQLETIDRKLAAFHDAWCVSDGADLPGAGNCCLADVDVTDQLREAIDIEING